jgi:hypothetical protein
LLHVDGLDLAITAANRQQAHLEHELLHVVNAKMILDDDRDRVGRRDAL